MATNEQLQHQLDEMREEMAALRRQLSAEARSDEARSDEQPARLLSRRNLLRAAPMAAVGGAVMALAPDPAVAATGDPVLQGRLNAAGNGVRTTLSGGTPGDGVAPGSTPALAVSGGVGADWLSADGVNVGIADDAQLDVLGDLTRAALAARFRGGVASGTRASAGGDCMEVTAVGPGTALVVDVLDGDSPVFGGPSGTLAATGIRSTAQSGSALIASSTEPTGSADAVTIDYAGTSRALYARSHNASNTNGTVTGVNEGQGIGVWGEQRNDTQNGFGVVGVGGRLGRGAQFSGGRAAVRMVPSSAPTHPSTGRVGDFFVDASARLWFCQKASTASASATWKQIA